jgi:hypothetical protein
MAWSLEADNAMDRFSDWMRRCSVVHIIQLREGKVVDSAAWYCR